MDTLRRSALSEHWHIKQKSSSVSSIVTQTTKFIAFERPVMLITILPVMLIWKLLVLSKGASSSWRCPALRYCCSISHFCHSCSPPWNSYKSKTKAKVFLSPNFLWDLLFTDPSRSFGTSWAPVRMTGVKQIAGLKGYIASSKRHTIGRADSPQPAAKVRATQAPQMAILLVNTDSRFSFYFFFPDTHKCLLIPFGRWI